VEVCHLVHLLELRQCCDERVSKDGVAHAGKKQTDPVSGSLRKGRAARAKLVKVAKMIDFIVIESGQKGKEDIHRKYIQTALTIKLFILDKRHLPLLSKSQKSQNHMSLRHVRRIINTWLPERAPQHGGWVSKKKADAGHCISQTFFSR
jgi:hypothetical protein